MVTLLLVSLLPTNAKYGCTAHWVKKSLPTRIRSVLGKKFLRCCGRMKSGGVAVVAAVVWVVGLVATL